MREFLLTRAEYAASRAKVDKINARAARRGWTGRISLTGTRETLRNTGSPPPFPDRPYGAEVVMVRAAIDGEAPCYGGWRFLAALDGRPTADGDDVVWIVRCAPGVSDELVDRSRLRQGWCDHCRTARPNRRHTYLVVYTETGELKQVGSTCIKDFTGWSGAPVFIADTTFDDELGGLGRRPDEFTPVCVVAVAAVAVEAAGWVPRAAYGSGRYPTADLIADYLIGTGRPAEAAQELLEPHLEAGHQLAPVIVDTLGAAWADRTGYEGNIAAALRAATAGVKEFGLLASTVTAYHRHLGDLKQAAQQEQAVERRWLGAVGDKVQITGVVRTALTVDGYAYNTTQRLVVVDAGPTLAKLYSSARWAYAVDAGDTVTIAATVKAHNTWQDQQQTVLTRAKRLDDPDSPTS